MMAERTLIVVTDWDIYKLNEDQRERFIALLEDLPEYCCIVFVYDTVAYKQNKTMKKLCKAMDAHVTPIEFKAQDTSDLTAWIARRFRALGKQIDRQTAEYLIFLCGGLMTGLSQEIAKIGAYAKGEVITQRDIDAVADPVLSAEIFKMTDAVSQGDYNRAAAILGSVVGVNTGKAVLVVELALLRVRKHLVCLVDLLELFLGFLVAGVIVRVVLHGQLAVSLFDLRVGSRLGYTQHFVVITFLLCHNPITSRISSNLPYIAAHCRFQYRQPQANLYKPDRPANGSPIRGAGERQRD
mgnify:CR=1 FL=1